ncbi:MAG TPA: XRE family transcriptional regulator, partial [Streptomyces sp.]|nr:XRE family transcriptional regulator [Streptomyces sp.]
MPNLLRKSDGQPIRDALKAKQLSYRKLAEATKDVDAAGKGVSLGTVSQVAGTGGTAKGDCRLRTAWLIAEGLDEPLQH